MYYLYIVNTNLLLLENNYLTPETVVLKLNIQTISALNPVIK